MDLNVLGRADIRTTELYFVRKEEDAEVTARRIEIRVTRRKSEGGPGKDQSVI